MLFLTDQASPIFLKELSLYPFVLLCSLLPVSGEPFSADPACHLLQSRTLSIPSRLSRANTAFVQLQLCARGCAYPLKSAIL